MIVGMPPCMNVFDEWDKIIKAFVYKFYFKVYKIKMLQNDFSLLLKN